MRLKNNLIVLVTKAEVRWRYVLSFEIFTVRTRHSTSRIPNLQKQQILQLLVKILLLLHASKNAANVSLPSFQGDMFSPSLNNSPVFLSLMLLSTYPCPCQWWPVSYFFHQWWSRRVEHLEILFLCSTCNHLYNYSGF